MSSRMQRTRERAYQIWEEEGRPEGREIDHWLQAEGELHEGVDAEDTQPDGRDTLAQHSEVHQLREAELSLMIV